MRKLAAVLCLFLSAWVGALAQNNYASATGSPTFSTQIPIENGFINVNNGDVHIEIPLATHAQRGRLQLDEKLVYDSKIWKIVDNGSYSWQPTNVPNSMGGWTFSSGLGSGSITYNNEPGQVVCNASAASDFNYDQMWGWRWTDPSGTVHPFYSVSTLQYSGTSAHCLTLPTGTPTSSGYATDGSGYYLQVTNYNQATITDPQGNTYQPTLAGSSAVVSSGAINADSNGNYFSTDSSGNLVDTLGRTPVLVTTSGNHIYYDVLVYNGTRARYTVTTETVNYYTEFLQSGVADAQGSFTAIQSIELPDGSSYSFTYGSGTGLGNYGELTSVTLPSGGVITYTYQNFLDSFQNQNRWIATRVKDGGTTKFTPATISQCSSTASCQEKQTVTDPAGNDAVYTFNLDQSSYADGGSWNTQIDQYQGSSTGGTKLKSVATSYTYNKYSIVLDESENGSLVTTVGPSYLTPASQTMVTTLDDVNLSMQTVTAYQFQWTIPASIKTWDYYSGSAPSTPTTETDYAYYSGSFPSTVTQKDGSGNVLTQTTYSYDQTTPVATSGLSQHEAVSAVRANLTTVSQLVNSSGATLNKTMSYDDAGTLLNSTDPNGQTTYGHDSTDTFVTSATPPTPSSGVSLTSTSTVDVSSGLVTGTTDPNGTVTAPQSYDDFGRPTQINITNGGTMYGESTFSYTPTTSSEHDYQNASTYADTETQYDSYGRASRVAVANGQSTNPWYQQDICYDSDGRVSFKSYSYQGNEWSTAKICSGAGDSYAYDALGRVTSITHSDGTSIGYTYTGRATKTVDENGVTRISQVDGLGRQTIACEISSNSSMPSSGSPISCGTDIAGTGFTTSYAYNLPSHLTTVTQGAQTRSFQTDWLGRTTQVQEPERGATSYSYSYNSTGLSVVRTRPQANQASSSTLTTTTTQYDAVGRVVNISYSDGTPTKSFFYDQANMYGGTVTAGASKGRLTQHSVSVLGNQAEEAYQYDAVGDVTAIDQCFPYGCNDPSKDKWSYYSYDWAGNLTTQEDGVAGMIGYAYSVADEVTQVTGGYSLSGSCCGTYNLVNNVQNGPNGPLNYQLGNGLSVVNGYDALGRASGEWACVGSTQSECSGGEQFYGHITSWSGRRSTGMCDSSLNNCEAFGYDEFNRLTSLTVTQGTAQNFSYAYDRYGNRWQQNVTAGTGPSSQLSFNTSNNQVSGYSYDAAGDITSDTLHSYTYDAEGNLTQVDGGATATYTYDALNRRIRVANSSNTVDYTFDALNRRLASWQENVNFGFSGKMYWGSSSLPIGYRNGPTHFQHLDSVGTVRAQTSYTGTVESSYISMPFGDGFAATGADDDPSHFAQLDKDYYGSADSQTDHAQFRQYSEAQGRWLSPDPYDGSYDPTNPQSFNRYAYVLNNPLSFTDPAGLTPDCGIDPKTGNLECTSWYSGGDSGGGNSGSCGVGCVGGYAPAGLGSFHGTLSPRPNRQLDPNGQECKALAAKIANIVADIESSTNDLALNPRALPDAPPFLGAPRKLFVQGHRELLDEKKQNLANRAHEYNQKCGGGDPFGGGAAASTPSTSSSTAPSISPEIKRGLIVAGGTIIIGGTVLLCPECLVLSPFAF